MSKNIDRLILHIGMHKTGTTTIQNYFFNQKRVGDIDYLDYKSANHSVGVYSLFCNNPYSYPMHKRAGRSKEDIDRFNLDFAQTLIENLNNPNINNLFISGEGISMLSKDELIKFKEFVEPFCNSIEIVAYAREFSSFVMSDFQHKVKVGSQNYNIKTSLPRYRLKFLKFYSLFGRENVKIYSYEDANGNILRDFSMKLGLPYKEIKESDRLNSSLTLEGLSILYIYRYFTSIGSSKRWIEQNRLLYNKISNIGSTKPKFTYKALKPYIESNIEDIEWISTQIGSKMLSDDIYSSGNIDSIEELLYPNSSTKEAFLELLDSYRVSTYIDWNKPKSIFNAIKILHQNIINKE